MRFKTKSGKFLNPVGYGCLQLSLLSSDEEASKLMLTAYKAGVNFFDTADIYFNGENEKRIGKALKNIVREDIFLGTKCGVITISMESVDSSGVLHTNPKDLNGSREHILKSCNESLSRLETTYIDVLYLHRIDPKVKLEESIGAMAELVKVGKVRWLGLSEVTAEEIRAAHSIHPISFVQNEFSLCSRDIEQNGVLATCEELGITVVGYSAVGRGFLSESFDKTVLLEQDYRTMFPRFQTANLEDNLQKRKPLEVMAKNKQVSVTQLSLAWMRMKGVVSIPATTKLDHLIENVESIKLFLGFSDMVLLDRNYPCSHFSGTRCPLISSKEEENKVKKDTVICAEFLIPVMEGPAEDLKNITAEEGKINNEKALLLSKHAAAIDKKTDITQKEKKMEQLKALKNFN